MDSCSLAHSEIDRKLKGVLVNTNLMLEFLFPALIHIYSCGKGSTCLPCVVWGTSESRRQELPSVADLGFFIRVKLYTICKFYIQFSKTIIQLQHNSI
jgi:hypothetical protein